MLPESISRRNFLTSAATLACTPSPDARLRFSTPPRPPGTADAVIVIWMAGGMAQNRATAGDPKRYLRSPGVRTEQVLSTFPAIDTAVDRIKFSQGLERVGAVIDRGAVIRTFQAADLGFILHSRHQYHWHTGYIPPPDRRRAAPRCRHRAKTLGPRNATVPAFVAIGRGNLEIGAESPALRNPFTPPDSSAPNTRPLPHQRSPGRRLRRSPAAELSARSASPAAANSTSPCSRASPFTSTAVIFSASLCCVRWMPPTAC